MTHHYTITLLPTPHRAHGLESVLCTAHAEGQEDRTWNVSPYKLAALLAERFGGTQIASIEEQLHKMKQVQLPGEYTALQLTELGFRMTKDVNKDVH